MNLHADRLYLEDLDRLIGQIPGREDLFGRTVLITGATGTIGSCIAGALFRMNHTLHAGIRVLLAGRSRERLDELFGEIGGEAYGFLPYELSEPPKWDEKVDYVIHAAGKAHPSAFLGDPVGTLTGSILGTAQLLSYASDHGAKRFLYVSSGEVYGLSDPSVTELREKDMGPLDLMSPRSCYPESKRAAENLCACWYHEYGLETVAARPCHTFGPVITPSDNRANAQFLRLAAEGRDIVLNSAGTQLRSYNYVCDAASAILTVLLSGDAGEAYNIANPAGRVTIAGLAELIAEAGGVRRIFADPDEAALAARSPIARQVLNTEKLERLGWRGAFSLKEAAAHTLRIMENKREKSN